MTLKMAKTDRQVYEEVLQQLLWDAEIDMVDVGVEADNGIVTLTGSVRSCAKKMAVEEATRRVEGVLDVVNAIQVHGPPAHACTDAEIAQSLRLALEWDVLVPHEQIQSTVVDGWVTLAGEVPYWFDGQHAERAVRKLTGVRGVTNNIAVHVALADEQSVKHVIEATLKRCAKIDTPHIVVEVKDGAVSLSGRVHNWSEKQAALWAAGYAIGVRKVEDHLWIEL